MKLVVRNPIYVTTAACMVLISISSVSTYLEQSTGLPFGNVVIWFPLHFLILCAFLIALSSFVSVGQLRLMWPLTLLLIYTLVNSFRGAFVAETYWDWKILITNCMGILLPVAAYAATNTQLAWGILRTYIFYALPIFIPLIFLVHTTSYGFYLSLLGLLFVFTPVIPFWWRVTLIGFAAVVFLADFGARSSIIKFCVPLALCCLYYFRRIISIHIYWFVHKILFVIPLVFLALGVGGQFNIFKMDEYIQGDYTAVNQNSSGEIVDENYLGDTRTFLYEEVLYSASHFDSWMFGRSPARGNLSSHFGDEDMNGRGERARNEVAILNIVNWLGVVGVVMFAIVMFVASGGAINRSNNDFIRILGIYVAFRWCFSWIEDINTFNLNYFTLWIAVGFCFSSRFRSMSNAEFVSWLSEVFRLPKFALRNI